jgi:hypothetical protein
MSLARDKAVDNNRFGGFEGPDCFDGRTRSADCVADGLGQKMTYGSDTDRNLRVPLVPELICLSRVEAVVMPRRPRINQAGHPQHVPQRGHNREASFFADEDCLSYLHWLR